MLLIADQEKTNFANIYILFDLSHLALKELGGGAWRGTRYKSIYKLYEVCI
tara:strand:- start:739 stop:891 length:153 start_codon:yes stop_codon:yes gene_type:complete